MSKATKRKHVTREVVEDEIELTEDQVIVKVRVCHFGLPVRALCVDFDFGSVMCDAYALVNCGYRILTN